MYYVTIVRPDYLEHHGIEGMHWGVRRYQNNDGTLTNAGKARYGEARKIKKQLTNADKYSADKQYDYKKYEIKRQKYVDKANKAKTKGNDKKASKFEDKAKEYETARDNAKNLVKRQVKKINSIINDAQSKGYDVAMTRVARMSSDVKFRATMNTIFGGAIFAASIETLDGMRIRSGGQKSKYSEGYKYKVTPGTGTVTEKRKDLKLA